MREMKKMKKMKKLRKIQFKIPKLTKNLNMLVKHLHPFPNQKSLTKKSKNPFMNKFQSNLIKIQMKAKMKN